MSFDIQRQVFFHQHSDHTERMAAQRKRILVARWQIADAEHADKRLQLVSQRDDHASHAARQGVTGEARLVMVFNGIGHFSTQTIVERVIAAHDALQLGELADHVGDEIALGEHRGMVGLLRQRFTAELLADRLGDGAHTRHTLALRAQLVVSGELKVNISAMTIEAKDGIFEGNVKVFVHDKDELENLVGALLRLQGIERVDRYDIE